MLRLLHFVFTNKYLSIKKEDKIEIGNQLYKYLISLKNNYSNEDNKFKLKLIKNRNRDLRSWFRIQDMALWDELN